MGLRAETIDKHFHRLLSIRMPMKSNDMPSRMLLMRLMVSNMLAAIDAKCGNYCSRSWVTIAFNQPQEDYDAAALQTFWR